MLRLDSGNPLLGNGKEKEGGVVNVSIAPAVRREDGEVDEITPWPVGARLPSRKGVVTPTTRAPTLEIMRRRSVEQEVQYLTEMQTQREGGEEGRGRGMILPEP